MGYIHHQRSRVDRRSVRVKLTDKGREVRDIVKASTSGTSARSIRSAASGRRIPHAQHALQRLERFWTDQILYRL